MKNTHDTIRNRTRDLPACSPVQQKILIFNAVYVYVVSWSAAWDSVSNLLYKPWQAKLQQIGSEQNWIHSTIS